MRYHDILPEQAKAHALRLVGLTINQTVTLGTFSADGFPNLRPLVLCAHDGLDALWFGTSLATGKVAEIKSNPKCVIAGAGAEKGGEFRLFGTMHLLSDSASRRRIWQDAFLWYFPDGVDSPDLVVMQFVPVRGEYRSQDAGGLGMGAFSL